MAKLLHLDGITMEDCTTAEQMFEEKLRLNLKKTVEASPISSAIIPLPTVFRDIHSWPKSTSLKCNICLSKFKTIPLFMPTYIIHTNPGIEIGVKGVMCGFPCIMAYIDLIYPLNAHGIINSRYKNMVYQLYKILYGKMVKTIQSSPLYTNLVEFGGSMSTSEYYEDIAQKNKKIHTCIIHPTNNGLSEFRKVEGPTVAELLYFNDEDDSDTGGGGTKDAYEEMMSEW